METHRQPLTIGQRRRYYRNCTTGAYASGGGGGRRKVKETPSITLRKFYATTETKMIIITATVDGAVRARAQTVLSPCVRGPCSFNAVSINEIYRVLGVNNACSWNAHGMYGRIVYCYTRIYPGKRIEPVPKDRARRGTYSPGPVPAPNISPSSRWCVVRG